MRRSLVPLMVLPLVASLSLASPLSLSPAFTACPRLCHRRGVCARGKCNCYVGYEGRACEAEAAGGDGARARTPTEHGGAARRKLRVVVVTNAAPRSTVFDDTDSVFPGLASARLLAEAGHDVDVVAHANQPEAHTREARFRDDASAMGAASFHLVHTSRHYYLPMHNTRAYESLAWMHDAALGGASRADAVFFHDGHGTPYYTALARVQAHGLLRTRVVCRLEQPHLWLQRHGGGGGATSVDDLEAAFLERESMRLCDVPVVDDLRTFGWTRARKWNVTAPPYVLRRALPPDHDVAGDDVAWSTPAAGSGVEVVFVIEGPGGGDTGAGVSAGKNDVQEQSTADDPPPDELEAAARARTPGARKLSLGAGDGSRFVLADVASAIAAAGAASAALADADVDSRLREVVFLMLGHDGAGQDAATRHIEATAAARAWPFAWRVMRGGTRDAIAYLMRAPSTPPQSASAIDDGASEFDIGGSGRKPARRRVAVLFARRFRGAGTPAIARRLVRAEARLRKAAASQKARAADPLRVDPNGDLYKPPSGVDVASQSWMGAGGAPKRRAAPRRAASRPRPKSSSSSSSSRKSNDKKSSDEGRSSRRGSSDDTRVRPSRSRARQIRRTVERYWKKGDTARITIAGQRYVRTRAGSRGSRPRAGARAYAISADDAKKMKKAAPKGGRGLKMVPAPLAHPTGSRSSIRQGKLGHRDAVRVNRG